MNRLLTNATALAIVVAVLSGPLAPLGAAWPASAAVSVPADQHPGVPRSVAGGAAVGPASHGAISPATADRFDPSQPRVLEYAPPAPWARLSAADLAAHDARYSPRNDPQSMSPAAVNLKMGDRKAIVILAEFSDVPHRAGGTQSYYDTMLNGNTSTSKSLRAYYYENSYGNFTLASTVSAWVTLPHTQAYYTTGQNVYYLASDAAVAANSIIDFSSFDEDGNGYIDNLLVIHSGGDWAAGCGSCIWSHNGYTNTVGVDGKYTFGYSTVAEFWETGASYGDALGVLAHECGHLIFKLPDLYDTGYANDGLGDWELMAGGSWADGARTPTHLTAWSKINIGWVVPLVPDANVDGYAIYPTSDLARANPVKFITDYTNEYFLVEFRSESGGGRFDRALPRDGLVIYHVDSSTIASTTLPVNTVESTTSHKGIDIEEVGFQDLDNINIGDAVPSNDVWVSNAAGFTPTSTPNSNLYAAGGGYRSNISVFNISGVLSAGGAHIVFSFDTGRVNFGLSGRVLGSPEQSVLPSSSATYTVEFTTFASSGDTATFSLEGAGASGASLDRGSATLPPFGSITVNLTVPMNAAASAGDSADVKVRATSTSLAQNNVVVPTLTTAAQVFDVDVLGMGSIGGTRVPDTVTRTDLTVRNMGNGLDNVSVSALFDAARVSAVVANEPLLMPRGGSTAVAIDVTILPTVLEGTVIPVTLDVAYGSVGAPLHRFYFANVTAGRLGRLALAVQTFGTGYLDPGGAALRNLNVRNDGNYLATVNLSASAPSGILLHFDVASLQVPPFSVQVVVVTIEPASDFEAWASGVVYFTATLADMPVSAMATLNFTMKQRYELTLGGDSAATALLGSEVIFNLVAVNLGNGMDNATVQVVPAFSEWNASLSAVNVTLTATPTGRSVAIFLTVTVPPNAGGNLLQEFTVTVTSQSSTVVATRRVTALVLPVYSFNVTVEAAQGPIGNSESATFLLNFRNTGNVRDSYSVTISGLPEGWRHEFVEGGVATIQPRFTGLMTLVIGPPASARADTYDFQVYASSEGDLAQRKIVLQHVTISPHREITLATTSVEGEVRPGATVTVHLIVRNLGNVQEGLVFEAPGNTFKSVDFDPFQVNVPAYNEAVATAVVVLNADQASGFAPLVVSVSSISNSSVSAEQTVGINVAKMPPPTTVPGADMILVGAALCVAAFANVTLARRRRS